MEPMWAVLVIIGLWHWWETREEKRRRERPERIKRQSRHMEIDLIVQIAQEHPQGEQWMRNILIADLKEIVARERAKEWAREKYGIDLGSDLGRETTGQPARGKRRKEWLAWLQGQ